MLQRNLCLLLILTAVGGVCAGCSIIKASPAASTPFLLHADELHPWHDRAPWDAVWSARPSEIMAKSDTPRKIFVAPVSTQYLNLKQNKNGTWAVTHIVPADDVKEVTDLMRQSFIDALKSAPAANLTVVDQPGPGVLVLELNLVELTPTTVALNAAADIGGVLVPGSKALEEVGSVGAQAVSGAIASGTIAMEFKISDGGTGEVLAEAKDREADPASVIPNYRDFEMYGWSRNTVKQWAAELAQIMSSPPDKPVGMQNQFSVIPW